jgi:hypothetical protein
VSEEEFDWHASEMAKTNPNVAPPELSNDPQTAAGEVVASGHEPELVEISTVRVLGDLVGTKLEAPNPELGPDEDRRSAPDVAAPARDERRGARLAPVALAIAVLVLAALAWALI